MFRRKISYVLLSSLSVLIVVLVISSLSQQRITDELPLYMQTDTIADKNSAEIEIQVLSLYKSDSTRIGIIVKDYLNIWSHLNNLFSTNDIESGKEYYTEAWFKRLEKNYRSALVSDFKRTDLKHKMNILTLSTDDLVCTIQDTVDIRIETKTTSLSEQYVVHMALLFQGDHWRIDAVDFEAIEPKLLTQTVKR